MKRSESQSVPNRLQTNMDFNQYDDNTFPKTLKDKATVAASEFFATAILVFVACMGCTPGLHSQSFLIQQSAFASGLAVTIVIFIFGHISKAHVNPLTSLAAVIVGEIQLSLFPIYAVPQIAGAVTGYGALVAVTPLMHLHSTEWNVCVTLPNPTLSTLQAVLAEMLLSLVLALANCSGFDIRNKDNASTAPLNYGFLVATLIMAGGPYSGASMNPAKSFAAALWNNKWQSHWIYWVSPLTAAAIAGFCYKLLFLRNISSINARTLSSRVDEKSVDHICL